MRPAHSRPDSTRIVDLLVITAAWCASLVLVRPAGDFPLNDDWSFGLAVRHLLASGDFRPTGWTSMPLVTNVLWGSLFCLPGGFSFTALRVSTLVMGWIGLLGTYQLVRETGQGRWLAVLAALTLGFSPIYYALSNTFMTDVPFTALSVWAAVFLVRTLKGGSRLDWLAGTALGVVATLSRQLGLCIPIAFGATLLLARGVTGRVLLRALVPVAACLAALFGLEAWLTASGRLPPLYHASVDKLLASPPGPRTLVAFFGKTDISLLYLGWFLLPLLAAGAAGLWRSRGTGARRALVLSFAGLLALNVVLAPVNQRRFIMPMSGNVVVASGIGPLTLAEDSLKRSSHVAPLPGVFWYAVTALSLLGAACLAAILALWLAEAASRLRARAMTPDHALTAFLLLGAVLQLVPMSLTRYFDRYTVPTLPLLAAGCLCVLSRLPGFAVVHTKALRITAVALLAASAIYSVAGTRDYLAWNRARWQALNELTVDRRVPPGEIDGGFEFGGLYLYDPDYAEDPGKSWWWVRNDRYRLAFAPRPGFTVVREYPYDRWLPPGRGSIVVLAAAPAAARPTR